MDTSLPGQRWLSEAEPDLGLGLVEEVDQRHVLVRFAASGQQRTYAARNAPLSRVRLGPDDKVRDPQGQELTVVRVDERGRCWRITVSTTQGSCHCCRNSCWMIACNSIAPGQTAGKAHRCRCLVHPALPIMAAVGGHVAAAGVRYAGSAYRADTPPAVYRCRGGIARPAACFVGRRGRSGQDHRGRPDPAPHDPDRACASVLVVLPDALVHQWLVEMLRRFNLPFAVFDQERFEQSDSDNAFHSEQRVLCSLSLLTGSPEVAQAALDGEWDLLIVDEAHHLTWSEDDSSLAYQLVEGLAARTPGVLLTATPEQLGRRHFWAPAPARSVLLP